MSNKLQLKCKVERAAGGCEFAAVTLLPAEMALLDGKSVKIDGETVRFKMWNGTRLYVNQRRWTLGYFALVDFDVAWGNPQVGLLHGDKPSPVIAQAVGQLLGIDEYRWIEIS
jgi:hypothetical protein